MVGTVSLNKFDENVEIRRELREYQKGKMDELKEFLISRDPYSI